MSRSPVVIPFSTDGVEVALKDGLALPANARGFIGVGYDGTNTRFILVDTSGRQRVVGGAAEGAAVAGDPLLVAGWDGTNVRTPRLFDVDTGAGSEHVFGVSLRKAGSGGSVELGTAADPIRTNPTGATPQPASQSGTWTVQQGTPPWSVKGTDASGAVPTQNPVLVAGQDGTNVKTFKTDTDGRIEFAPSGATATTKGFSDGNVVLATTTVSAIRSTTYTEPASGAQRSIASADVDDAAGDTGARTVEITYYKLTAGVVTGPFAETITMNGTTPVNTVATDIWAVEKMKVLTAGSTGSNEGVITLYNSTGGAGGTLWSIALGANKTFGAHHYVPSGKTCRITSFIGGIKGADTSGFFIRAKDPTDANAAELQISDLLRAPSSGSTPLRTYGTPIEVVGPSRITAFAVPDSTSSRTYYASFDFYEQ